MAAIRRASSRVRRCAAERLSRFILETDVGDGRSQQTLCWLPPSKSARSRSLKAYSARHKDVVLHIFADLEARHFAHGLNFGEPSIFFGGSGENGCCNKVSVLRSDDFTLEGSVECLLGEGDNSIVFEQNEFAIVGFYCATNIKPKVALPRGTSQSPVGGITVPLIFGP